MTTQKMQKTRGYNVYYAPDGDETYLGIVASLRDARRLASRHVRGGGLPDCLYATAEAAGHCGGISAPDKSIEVDPADKRIRWLGRGGWYCAVPLIGGDA